MTSIGVIGMGFVGGALARGLVHYTNMVCYDKHKNIGSLKSVCTQDILFVAVPTPMKEDGSVDTSIVESVLEDIHNEISNNAPHEFYKKPVVLRSTLPPNFFKDMSVRFGGLEILYMPEFLTERTADLDFIMSSRFILGSKEGKTTYAVYKIREIFEHRFPGTRFSIMSWEAASMVKYTTNNFFAVKLSFFNEVYEVCKALGEDPHEIISEVLQDGRIGRSHFQVPGHDGHMGWGGHCFLKDNRGYQTFARELGIIPTMAKAAWDKNLQCRTPEVISKELRDMFGRASSAEITDDSLEEWAPIKEFEDYSVSTFGRIRSFKRGDNLLKLSEDSDGYLIFSPYCKDKQAKVTRTVHRVVADTFIRPRLPEEEINHKDGNKKNNKLSNLEIITKSYHVKITKDNGQICCGEEVNTAKLTEDQVRLIRQLYNEGRSARVLASEFKVSKSGILAIVNNKTWKHVI